MTGQDLLASPATWVGPLDCGCAPWTGRRCPTAADLWNRHAAAHRVSLAAFAAYEATGCRDDALYNAWQDTVRRTDVEWADYCAHLGEPIDDVEGGIYA